MRHFSFVMFGLLVQGLAALTLLSLDGATAQEPAIGVLIVTGIDHPAHDWRTTTPALEAELAKDRRMKVSVLADPYQLGESELTKHQVVLLHFNNWERPDPGSAARENLRRFVERGGGLVLIHFACGAFSDWPEFPKLAGRIWDRKNTHDGRGPFRVEIVDKRHPITRGLEPFETDDELYTGLTGDQPIHLLAAARSKTTLTDQPMAFTLAYGKGRVFHTPLGHDARAIHTPSVAELLRRGVAWTAKAVVAP